MNIELVKEIVYVTFKKYPDEIDRFETGLANFVYKVRMDEDVFVIRVSGNDDEFNSTYWINRLSHLNIKIPKIRFQGELNGNKYLIMNFIEGNDLGNVYHTLTDHEKKDIAQDISNIQKEVAKLPYGNGYGCVGSYNDNSFKKTWIDVLLSDLDRSRTWMSGKNIFSISKIDEVEALLKSYSEYFSKVEPVPFLDDITTKNVLINEGHLSGIIDLDWICFGDYLYFIALTNMSLLSMGADTSYIDYLIENFELSSFQKEIILIYTLIFCVIFMSETGMSFNKEKPTEIDTVKVNKLNYYYKELYDLLHSRNT